MDIETELKKAGLTREQYESLMNDVQDKINGVQDLDWSEIVTKYNLSLTTSYLRHAFLSTPYGTAFAKEYYENKENIPQTYAEQMDKIRKEKQKLSDERTALRKLSRDAARYEQNLEYLEQLIRDRNFPNIQVPAKDIYTLDNDLLICCSDIHYGLDVKNGFGEYNSDIASERMDKYFQRRLEIKELHHSQNAWILLGGDLISGLIHNSVMLQNRENIVEQVQGVSELISLFIYKLSKYFDNVYVNGTCGGNHSRANQDKSQVLRGERLDLLVPWYVNARLSVIPNVHMLTDSVDSTIAIMNIRGKFYAGVHGDMDSFSEAGIHKLQTMIGSTVPIEAAIYGHLHHCSYDDVANVKLVRSGSFCDAIDDYSISKRIVGHASQMVMVVDEDGIKTFYPVDLR